MIERQSEEEVKEAAPEHKMKVKQKLKAQKHEFEGEEEEKEVKGEVVFVESRKQKLEEE